MQELKILSEDASKCFLTWPKIDVANKYILEGMTSIFYYEKIQSFDKDTNMTVLLKNNNKRYVSYRVRYMYVDTVTGDSMIVDVTNDIKMNSVLSKIELAAIESYEGGSIVFLSDVHYDKYRLYNKVTKECVETEDCIVTGHFVKSSKTYYVEGFTKCEDGSYVLAAASDEWCCHFDDVVSTETIISVIIPVYNCYDFLSRTIDSILLSTFKNFEIILVNDGSSDDSQVVCDWYANKYSKIVKSYKKENGGVCSARNYGMDNSVGEFIAFVDNDDIVHPYMYEKLYQATIDEHTDIAIAQTIMREDFNSYQVVLCDKTPPGKNVIMNSFDEVLSAKGAFRNIYFVAIWNKIIRRNIATKVRFVDDLPYYEDTAYTSTVYTYIDKFVLVKGAYYIWDKRKQKTVGTASTMHYHRPSEVIWKYYILSYAAPLFQGNTDNKTVMDSYKYDVLRHLLEKYSGKDFAKPIKNVFRGMLKYLVNTYDLPVMKLLLSENDKKLYAAWNEIEHSNIEEYDGQGDIPTAYYQG